MINRWLIRGTLRAESPLMIGSGKTTDRDELVNDEGKKVAINAVDVDASGNPMIPGSSLKGVLHSALLEVIRDANDPLAGLMYTVFGKPENSKLDQDLGLGGKAEFLDAVMSTSTAIEQSSEFSFLKSHKDVKAGVAINRQRKAAADEKLFHHEFVPAGTEFEVKIAARNMSDEETAFLLAALELINRDDLSFGGDTANGYGNLKWTLKMDTSIVVDESSIDKWVKANYPTLENWSPASDARFKKVVEMRDNISFQQSNAVHVISVKIKIDGPLLARRLAPPKKEGEPDARPIKNLAGEYFVPAESFRGVMRSQAEKIVRTLGGHACDPSSDHACPAVTDMQQWESRCLVCRTLGVSGARSLIFFSDLNVSDRKKLTGNQAGAKSEDGLYIQELLAIDRFTGGSADGKKFTYESVFQPELDGKIGFRKLELWQKELLYLTLRDLRDGDITLGSGSARGYGVCRCVRFDEDDMKLLSGEEFNGALGTEIARMTNDKANSEAR